MNFFFGSGDSKKNESKTNTASSPLAKPVEQISNTSSNNNNNNNTQSNNTLSPSRSRDENEIDESFGVGGTQDESVIIEDYEDAPDEDVNGFRSRVPTGLQELENRVKEEEVKEVEQNEKRKSLQQQDPKSKNLTPQPEEPLKEQVRKYHDEDISHPNWPLHKKHFFVLSSAGKPIYSRYGDEQNLSPFMASLTAVVSFVIDLKDNIRWIVAGKHKFVFLDKTHLILVAACCTSEPVSTINHQLNYLYSQIISILTGGLHQIFEKRPYFDLRNLFGGGTRYLDQLNHVMDHDPSFLLSGVHALRLDSSVRQGVANAIQSVQHSDLLYGLIISDYRLVTLIRPKRYALQPSDLHLIMNFVNSSSSLSGQASWCPLCLPKFNDQGFLHVYIQSIAPRVNLLLISLKQEGFFTMHECQEKIVSALNKIDAITAISRAVSVGGYSVADLGIPSLYHFLYKSKTVTQTTCPIIGAPYNTPKQKKKLFRLYQTVHKRLFEFKNIHKLYYQVSNSETVICWVNPGRFELYAVFSPLESKSECIRASKDILRWIKSEENSLFILNSPVW